MDAATAAQIAPALGQLTLKSEYPKIETLFGFGGGGWPRENTNERPTKGARRERD